MAERHERDDAYQAAHAVESSHRRASSFPRGRGRRVNTGSHRSVSPRTFPASLGWSVAGTLLPGLGLTRTRWRALGLVMLTLTVLLLVGGALLALVAPNVALSALVLPNMLTVAWVLVAAFGILWAASIVVTHLLLRPASVSAWQRVLGSVVVGALVLGVSVPSFAGARAIHDTSLLIDDVFGHEGGTGDQQFGTPVDPWANKPRLNVLVLGGDAGADRTGTRTDTVILASIDTHTGDMVLFSLPRQTQRIPFPEGTPLAKAWPNGFTNGILNDQNFALNAMYDSVPALTPDAIPEGVENPGAEALKLGVGAALGLEVDHYVMVNMEGFVEFVNALGGITVNINRPVPVGGRTDGDVPPDRWLPPGPDQHLNGENALWYARGRYGIATGDYDRMSRQRCVIRAVVDEINPTTVLANYEALARAGREIVSSDVPNRQLPALVALSLKVKDGTMTSVSFENDKDGFSTSRPDWELVQERVQSAINPPPPAPETTPAEPTSEGPTSESPSTGPAGQPSSLEDECAYNPAPFPGEDG